MHSAQAEVHNEHNASVRTENREVCSTQSAKTDAESDLRELKPNSVCGRKP